MTSLLPETGPVGRRRVARAQAAGRVPSLALGVVRDGALLHFATPAGRAPGDARPDPNTQYRIGSITKTMTATMVHAAARRGPASRSTTCSTGTCRARRSAASRCASCSGTRRACSASRTARGGSGTAGDDIDALLADLTFDKLAGPPAPHVPLLQPGVRAARRGAAAGHRGGLGRPGRQAGARPAGHEAHHVRTRSSRTPAGYVVHPLDGDACTRSRAPTPARWPRPASSGPRSTDLAQVGGVPGRPGAGRCSPRHASTRCARRW